MMVSLNRHAIVPHVHLSLHRRAEQIMGMTEETMRRWTAREVRDLVETAPLATPSYELVDGALLVTPGPSMPHQNAVRQLLLALSPYLDRESAGVTVCSPSDVELEAEDLRQPDVYVMTVPEWRRVIREGNPVHELLLAIEILSP